MRHERGNKLSYTLTQADLAFQIRFDTAPVVIDAVGGQVVSLDNRWFATLDTAQFVAKLLGATVISEPFTVINPGVDKIPSGDPIYSVPPTWYVLQFKAANTRPVYANAGEYADVLARNGLQLGLQILQQSLNGLDVATPTIIFPTGPDLPGVPSSGLGAL